jgi:hypothetical protein
VLIKLVCHPGKHTSTYLDKNIALAGVFIRGPVFYLTVRKKFFSSLAKDWAPDKYACKYSSSLNKSNGIFSGVTHLLI